MTHLAAQLGAAGAACVCGLALLTAVGGETVHVTERPRLIRIGISPGTWGGVNRNDAAAAISAWAQTIMKQRGTDLKAETRLFESMADVAAALERGEIDALSSLTDQFLTLDRSFWPETIFIAARNESLTERYVLLARSDSDVHDIPGLRNRKLVLQSNARTSLAPAWLEGLLRQHSLGSAEEMLGGMTRNENPSKAVLQVFFRQADAAIVTANVFAIANELNPQLRKQLRVLAESREVIPAVFFFRPSYRLRERALLEEALLTVHETPTGQQVLTVFQSDRLVLRPVSCLDSSFELLASHQRLPGGTNATTQARNPGAPQVVTEGGAR